VEKTRQFYDVKNVAQILNTVMRGIMISTEFHVNQEKRKELTTKFNVGRRRDIPRMCHKTCGLVALFGTMEFSVHKRLFCIAIVDLLK
jgi:hypothetical protein